MLAARKARWQEFDAGVEWWRSRKLAPAFLQEIVDGLWCVQVLVEPRSYGWLYRLFRDPPKGTFGREPFYNGWPGDHRGWMRFESKEAARDFYKFATGRISFEEYRERPHRPLSNVTIDLDESGDFAPSAAVTVR